MRSTIVNVIAAEIDPIADQRPESGERQSKSDEEDLERTERMM